MHKPRALRPGDRVAAVSLSSGLAGEGAVIERFSLAQRRLSEHFSLELCPMPNALRGIEYLDRHPQARAEDWMAAVADPDIAGIFCTIGGEDSIRLLPHVDFGLLAANPKVFLGYSDTTVSHFMLYKAGVTSYYGPCLLMEFAENVAMHAYTSEHVVRALMDPPATQTILPSPEWTSEFLDWGDPSNNARRRSMTPDPRGYVLLQGEGVAEGPLIGGCLDVLPMLIGTELWPSAGHFQSALLFLETSEECPPPSLLRYLLRNLAAQGLLERIGGILFGKPYHGRYEAEYWAVLRRVVAEEAGRPTLPILCNLNFGHTSPICTLPYGLRARIDCAARRLSLLEPPTGPA
ncbi:MAG: LD-carboxypeptidase [Clostridiales bacterium]|nr:LD-carboxypeptidase [Clostridiales bacterium]